MKRSEMIASLVAWGKSNYVTTDDEIELVEMLLDKIIELGMLPPVVPGKPKAKVLARCIWEPENG